MITGCFCPVCKAQTIILGNQIGILDNREFVIRHCESCRLSYVENYRTDFENIYGKNYYMGNGADPMVDYVYEINNASKTIRNYEWKGVFRIYKKLCPNGNNWLDYGCGAGGLVKFAIEKGINAVGFEEGWAAGMGKASGIPIICETQLENYTGSFDFISAIEVLEHVPKPVETLAQIRKLLKPGGVLFITTGNAEPWRKNLLEWGYTKCPDVHISFYEPETLAYCMRKVGLQPKDFTCFDGFDDIIKYKVLKTLRIKNKSALIDAMPWVLISKFVNWRHKVSKQPYGIAIEDQ